ncbi:NF-kappa-B-repressing factor isoform X2 [Drosophila eugracilis]|uniref:NF-kappa-B-repressing factor isoform X2 n=1 Tax=Drosophila eugracilis TaxID=29029 RepID=UPI0007E618A0|nr:NF-kappa-B-repressing factor isoform X2 [Drosophila eugracilis]
MSAAPKRQKVENTAQETKIKPKEKKVKAKTQDAGYGSGRRAAAAPAADSQKDSSNRSTRERLCFGGGEPINLFQGLRFGQLILFLAGGRNCLRNSCTSANLKYEERASKDQPATAMTKYADVLINDEVIASGQGENIKAARFAAFKQALLFLQSHCYSIKLNATRETIKVKRSKKGVKIDVTKDSADSQGDQKLDESNKGYRMMRLMGWAGGGLGRQKQGIEEPVSYLMKINRNGLGSKQPQGILEDYRTLIENYVNSDDMRDMLFEPTFSKEERAAFHQMVSRFGLRSSSHGAGQTRQLLITKKVSYAEILTEVLSRRNPKFCERYFVQVPMQKALLFPGHVAELVLENMCE